MFVVVVILVVFFNVYDGSEITLITAFFDIGRKNHHVDVENDPRTIRTYLRYFEGWARIKNCLVAFCQSEPIKNEMLEIRKKFGMNEKTEVIVIDDIYSVEREMYEKMVDISKNPFFLRFRVGKKVWRENNPEYDYVTNLKSYFLYRASAECAIKTERVAWIDFGYNHGSELYRFSQDWSYSLDCKLSDRISLFFLVWDKRPLFEIIRTVKPDGITSGFIVCPTNLAKDLWTLLKESIYDMLFLGLVDDDQTLFTLASRRKPEIFSLILTKDWFLPVKEYCNGKHMRGFFPQKRRKLKKKKKK